jgi:hypothetical protein
MSEVQIMKIYGDIPITGLTSKVKSGWGGEVVSFECKTPFIWCFLRKLNDFGFWVLWNSNLFLVSVLFKQRFSLWIKKGKNHEQLSRKGQLVPLHFFCLFNGIVFMENRWICVFKHPILGGGEEAISALLSTTLFY